MEHQKNAPLIAFYSKVLKFNQKEKASEIRILFINHFYFIL